MSIDQLLNGHIMNEKELSNELNNWFNNADSNKPHFWERNKVGKIIKNQLEKCGHWKIKLNGSSKGRKKGFRKMQWVIACRNGYDGPFEG